MKKFKLLKKILFAAMIMGGCLCLGAGAREVKAAETTGTVELQTRVSEYGTYINTGLEGVQFELYTEGNNLVGIDYTDQNGVIELELEPGHYYFYEATHPERYYSLPYSWDFGNEKIYFDITAGNVKTLDVDYKLATGTVKLQTFYYYNENYEKVSLNDVVLALYTGDGHSVGNYTTDQNGEIELELEPGEYFFAEKKHPYSYFSDSFSHNYGHERISFLITTGNMITLPVEYYPLTRDVNIICKDTDGNTIPGAEFALYASKTKTTLMYANYEGTMHYTFGTLEYTYTGNETKTTTTSSLTTYSGELYLWRLPVKDPYSWNDYYILKETKAPDGYETTGREEEFTLETSGSTQIVTITYSKSEPEAEEPEKTKPIVTPGDLTNVYISKLRIRRIVVFDRDGNIGVYPKY